MNVSLVDLCLSTIVDNFAKLNNDFKKTKDDYKKREFEFLQRKYSFELLNRLSEKDDLPEEYVDLLVNKYLKFLDTNWFKSCKWDKVTSKFAEIGHNIEKILINGSQPKNVPWQDLICYLPNLKVSTFQRKCYDMFLKNVAKFCCNIEEIHVMRSFKSKKQNLNLSELKDLKKHLCKDENGKALCTNLKILDLPNKLISMDDLKYLLTNLPSLEILDCIGSGDMLYSMHKKNSSSLDKIKPYNLTALNFTKIECNENYFKICMLLCPNLKCLKVILEKKNQLDYLLSYLPQLEKLTFYLEQDVVHYDVTNILKSKGRKLTHLQLFSCSVSDSGLANACPHLEDLVLVNVRILSKGDPNFEFDSLSHLVVRGGYVTKFSGINYKLLLSQSKQLKSLEFFLTDFSPSEIKSGLLRCSERNPIERFSFRDCSIEIEFLKVLLLNCRSLKCLEVLCCFQRSEMDLLLKFSKTIPSKPKICTDSYESIVVI